MVVKGLKEIQNKAAEASELANQNRVRYLFLDDGESASLRFINDDEIIQTKIHSYKEMTPDGERWRSAYCSANLTGTPCKWDAIGNIPSNVYVSLVYVYHAIRKRQNPELNTNPDAVKWAAVNQGNQVLYKEDIDEVRILRTKFGKDGYLKNMILGFVNVYGTLCNRDYNYSRSGKGIRTGYSFIPNDPSEMSDKVKDAIKEAPPIEDIIIGNVKKSESFKQNSEEVQDTEQLSVKDVDDLF